MKPKRIFYLIVLLFTALAITAQQTDAPNADRTYYYRQTGVVRNNTLGAGGQHGAVYHVYAQGLLRFRQERDAGGGRLSRVSGHWQRRARLRGRHLLGESLLLFYEGLLRIRQ